MEQVQQNVEARFFWNILVKLIHAPCGVCDVCKSLEFMGLTNFDFAKISERVKKILETLVRMKSYC